MVISIDELRQKIHRPVHPVTKVAASPGQAGPEPNDDGPNNDPPFSLRLAA